jgi:hypothetical protein
MILNHHMEVRTFRFLPRKSTVKFLELPPNEFFDFPHALLRRFGIDPVSVDQRKRPCSAQVAHVHAVGQHDRNFGISFFQLFQLQQNKGITIANLYDDNSKPDKRQLLCGRFIPDRFSASARFIKSKKRV